MEDLNINNFKKSNFIYYLDKKRYHIDINILPAFWYQSVFFIYNVFIFFKNLFYWYFYSYLLLVQVK